MTTDEKKKTEQFFVCLSGGGFRASLFQLGALKRLHESGLLPHVLAYSATSGGSYVAACLALFRNLGYDEKRQPFLVDDWDGIEQMVLRFASKGVLRLTALLVTIFALYGIAATIAAIDLIGLVQTAKLAAGIFICGLLLHLYLFLIVRKSMSKQVDWFKYFDHVERVGDTPHDQPRQTRRLLRMLISPSYLRCQTLNFMGFDGRPLCAVSVLPSIYVTVVDLNDGKEKVFSPPGILSALDATGTRELWEQRSKRFATDARNVELAEMVAASSAIPPLFKPVTLGGLGAFVDGGITDNLAMNVPKALASEINAERGRYSAGSSIPDFTHSVQRVIVIDGSKPIALRPASTRWTQWSFRRVLDAISNQAVLDAGNAALNFARNVKIPSHILALSNGFVGPATEFSSEISDALTAAVCRVRTHLDGFSTEECAVLMYCGYLQAELLLQENADLRRHASFKDAPLRDVTQMLPSAYPAVKADWAALSAHMQASNSLFSLWRGVRRVLNF
jgi:predicted acylesterase/phospholipase RssA